MLSLLDFRIHVSSQPCLVWYLHNDRSNVYRQVLENMVLWWITRQHGSVVVFLVWVSLWMVYGSMDGSMDGWVSYTNKCVFCAWTRNKISQPSFFPFLALCLPNNRSVLMAVIVEKSKKVLDFYPSHESTTDMNFSIMVGGDCRSATYHTTRGVRGVVRTA